MAWRPGRYERVRTLEAPFEDLPDHLFWPVWSWLGPRLQQSGPTLLTVIGLHFRVTLSSAEQVRADEAVAVLRERCREDRGFLLDLVEFVLRAVCEPQRDRAGAAKLETILKVGHSAYTVKSDLTGLEMRLDPEVKAQVQSVVDSADGSAGEHLATAWNEAYGRLGDPAKSYSESIKAVEAALAATVSPQNARQTLGTMRHDLTVKPEKWVFDLGGTDGVATVIGLISALWDGQTSRHGGVRRTRVESVEEARAAVHLAAALVQFGASGAFRRADAAPASIPAATSAATSAQAG